MNRLLLTLTMLTLPACFTETERGTNTLAALGFTDVRWGAYAPFMCGDDYQYATHFVAKNAQGKLVSGVSCCGAWKGCTVKF